MHNNAAINYKSQYQQDKIVDYLFKGHKYGFFIDIGAHDGVSFSNSYFFERTRKWTGVCFEPIHDLYLELVKNRECRCINGAISNRTELVKFTRGTGYIEMLSGISKFRDDKHIARTEKDIAKFGGNLVEIEVQAYSLNEFLQDNNILEIDFLSLDIEGGEYEVLKSIDMSKVSIKSIAVELNFIETKDKIEKLLNDNDFFLAILTGADGIFLHRKHFNPFHYRVNRLRLEGFMKEQYERIINKLKRYFIVLC